MRETKDMRRDFANRDELIAYVKAEFPKAVAVDDHVSKVKGGRAAAKRLMERIDPQTYAQTRNKLHGAVTKLSPYIRYGVVSLVEVREKALDKVRRRRNDAEKLINELAWRDYWQRVYARIGERIWSDQEDYKTGFTAHHYADFLPEDIAEGKTGLNCIDGFAKELRETGYLHNHARMWTAAYVVHWRRVKWQAGARWFLSHLLDGDPASNNLSWQWVASTFSQKPYIFNRENVERNTNGIYCKGCALYGHCDFEGSYERIERELFPNMPASIARPVDNPSRPFSSRPYKGGKKPKGRR